MVVSDNNLKILLYYVTLKIRLVQIDYMHGLFYIMVSRKTNILMVCQLLHVVLFKGQVSLWQGPVCRLDDHIWYRRVYFPGRIQLIWLILLLLVGPKCFIPHYLTYTIWINFAVAPHANSSSCFKRGETALNWSFLWLCPCKQLLLACNIYIYIFLNIIHNQLLMWLMIWAYITAKMIYNEYRPIQLLLNAN